MIRFDGRVALVTGAGAGLGRSHALLLASRGAKVVVNDLGGSLTGQGVSSSAADQVVAEIKAAGGDAVANHASVSDRDGAESMVQAALDQFGRIDIVINNAGIIRDRSFAKMSLDDFELVLKVHLLGSVYVTKAAWPHLIGQGYGRIVLTTSGSGLVGNFGQTNYSAAKTAMLGLMSNLKIEGAKANVRVNAISPVAHTRMTENLNAPGMQELLKPEQVSPAVAWLSSEACDVSGEIIAAGGGYFSRVKLVKSPGVVFARRDGRSVSIEEFAERRQEIFDLSQAEPYERTLDDHVLARMGVK